MREHRLRTIWKSGGAVANGGLAIPNSFSAETMAHQGWDSLTIDLQHGMVDYQAMIPMLQAISTTHTVPVVRGFETHCQELPVCHHQLGCAPDGRRRAGGDGEDARGQRGPCIRNHGCIPSACDGLNWKRNPFNLSESGEMS